jgi:hypothetical protein
MGKMRLVLFLVKLPDLINLSWFKSGFSGFKDFQDLRFL